MALNITAWSHQAFPLVEKSDGDQLLVFTANIEVHDRAGLEYLMDEPEYLPGEVGSICTDKPYFKAVKKDDGSQKRDGPNAICCIGWCYPEDDRQDLLAANDGMDFVAKDMPSPGCGVTPLGIPIGMIPGFEQRSIDDQVTSCDRTQQNELPYQGKEEK